MNSPNVPITAVKLEPTPGQGTHEGSGSTSSVHSKVTPQQAKAVSSTPFPATVSTILKPQVQQPAVLVVPRIQESVQSHTQQHTKVNLGATKVVNPTTSAIHHPKAIVPSHPGNTVAKTTPNLSLDPQLSSKQAKKKKAVVTMAVAQSATPAANQGENTGRWTAEEHRLFLQGLEQHGKGWKKIASLIKSRTVVQIRTHAQKYFQKLAKARQNGEEGDIIMENRERISTSSSSKRRRSGTKRKAIQSVVASAQREAKRRAAATTNDVVAQGQSEDGVFSHLPTVAPALAPFVSNFQSVTSTSAPGTSNNLTIPTGFGNIPASVLEDSLFRYLTPAPNETDYPANSPPNVNEIARQAGANPITVPTSSFIHEKNTQVGGDVSPTGVADFPSTWAWGSIEPPAWYTKGTDVDDLLNEAEALDWLADSGACDESYTPSPDEFENNHNLFQAPVLANEVYGSTLSEPSLLSVSAGVKEPGNVHSTTIGLLESHKAPSVPILDNSATINRAQDLKGVSPSPSALNIPPLPSFFESSNDLASIRKSNTKPSFNNLFSSATEAADAASNDLLLEQFDEQAFVTALLDQDSTNNLLGHHQ